MAIEQETIIEITHLRKRFKKLVAVSDLSLNVHRGDVFGFLGPNGAGKSTTIRILLDLIRPTQGKVKLFGLPLRTNRVSVLSRIGALVEKPDFYGYLSARQNLRLFGKMLGDVPDKQIDAVLETVRLYDRADDRFKSFSHGMKQRLGIAQTLLGNPELIILDEPTVGLDPEGMKEVRELIIELVQRNITIFLSSHLLHEVEQVCNRMAIINKGKLIVEGSVQELLRQGPMVLVVEVDQPTAAAEKVSRLDYVQRVTAYSRLLKIELAYQDIPRLNQFLLTENFLVFRLQPQTSLEDYYLSLVQG